MKRSFITSRLLRVKCSPLCNHSLAAMRALRAVRSRAGIMLAGAIGFLFVACFFPATLRAEPGGLAIDASYFRHSPRKLDRAVKGVLTILVNSNTRSARLGIRTLVLRTKPDPAAAKALECGSLLPRDLNSGDASSQDRGSPPEKQVCGLRLLGWTVDAPADRIEVAVTAEIQKGRERWLEVVIDPEENRRGWLHFEFSPKASPESPLMEYLPLGRWIASTGAVRRRPYGSYGALMLRHSPTDRGPLVAEQPSAVDINSQNIRRIVHPPPFDPDAVPLRYLGIQGSWVRVELAARNCRSEEPGIDEPNRPSTFPACVVGWIPWRSPDGELLVYPIIP